MQPSASRLGKASAEDAAGASGVPRQALPVPARLDVSEDTGQDSTCKGQVSCKALCRCLEPIVPMLLVSLSAAFLSMNMLLAELLSDPDRGGMSTFETTLVLSMGSWSCTLVAQAVRRRVGLQKAWRHIRMSGGSPAVVRRKSVLVEFFGDRKRLPWLFFRSFTGFVAMGFAFLSLRRLDVGDASALFMTAPLHSAILACLVLGEPFDLADLIVFLTGISGATLIARPGFLFKGGSLDPIGVAQGLCAAIFAAAALLSSRWLSTGSLKTHWLVIVNIKALGGLCMSAVILAFMAAAGNFGVRMPHGPQEWVMLLVQGPCEFIGLVFLTIGLSRERAGPAAMMRLWDVVLSFVWQATLLRQPVRGTSLAGTALVMLALASTVLRRWCRERGSSGRAYGTLGAEPEGLEAPSGDPGQEGAELGQDHTDVAVVTDIAAPVAEEMGASAQEPLDETPIFLRQRSGSKG